MEKHNPVTISHAVRAGITTLVALAIGAGCAVGPNYQRPAVVTPDHFRFAENPPPDSLGDLPWWKVFQDPALQELIRAALTNNYDLKQAVARVEESLGQLLALPKNNASALSRFWEKTLEQEIQHAVAQLFAELQKLREIMGTRA